MSKNTIIPAGYRITFVSWENDVDNYKTIIKEGLDLQTTSFLVELAEILKARKTGLENKYEPSEVRYEQAYEVLLPIFLKHSDFFSKEWVEKITDDERIKVLIGSGTIKEGMNLQAKSTVLYNCFLFVKLL
jgi:hypothetical protein